nr:uncharacterized protein LOC126539185 isoform X1 [Dermacentor andersoni]XP_054931210.1 uncharacterized protein LOC126539185 isoform X1 [Dermacentor andersoni]
MLANGALVIYLLCVSLTEAMLIFNNVEFTSYHCDLTSKGECILLNNTFSGRVSIPGQCQRWSCYPESKIVVVAGCGKVPYGCYSSVVLDSPFPHCCITKCYPDTFSCLTPERMLMLNNEEYNSTKPCVRYSCRNGALATITCPGYARKICAAENINTSLPFPTCCAVGKACAVEK